MALGTAPIELFARSISGSSGNGLALGLRLFLRPLTGQKDFSMKRSNSKNGKKRKSQSTSKFSSTGSSSARNGQASDASCCDGMCICELTKTIRESLVASRGCSEEEAEDIIAQYNGSISTAAELNFMAALATLLVGLAGRPFDITVRRLVLEKDGMVEDFGEDPSELD